MFLPVFTVFYLGNGRGVRPLFAGHHSLVFHCVFANCQLATFHREVKDWWYRVFLEYKLTKLERGSQQNNNNNNNNKHLCEVYMK